MTDAVSFDPWTDTLKDPDGLFRSRWLDTCLKHDVGLAHDPDVLEQLLTLPALVVLDEAYVEFGGTSRVQWVSENANLIVLRTFSKWAGLAGLRVGYGAFPLELSQHLWKIKQPYNVNVAGQIAALVSLADREYLLQNVARLVAQREQLVHTLDQFDWLEPYPGQANFILCRIKGRQAREIKHNLAEQGIPLLTKETLEKDLNSRLKAPSFVASALSGVNVAETMKKAIALTVVSLKDKLKL